MRKKVLALALALAGLALPAMALAKQPVLIRVDGHEVPVREVVQVMHTAAGPVYVRTWSWRGPNGAATFQVSESRGASAALPAWAMAQMGALRAQMRLIEAALTRPLLMPSLPVPTVYGQPLLLPLPGQVPVEVRFLQPMIRLRALPVPVRVLVVLPSPTPHVAAPAPARSRGRLV
jgi:hypothetical protein